MISNATAKIVSTHCMLHVRTYWDIFDVWIKRSVKHFLHCTLKVLMAPKSCVLESVQDLNFWLHIRSIKLWPMIKRGHYFFIHLTKINITTKYCKILIISGKPIESFYWFPTKAWLLQVTSFSKKAVTNHSTVMRFQQLQSRQA